MGYTLTASDVWTAVYEWAGYDNGKEPPRRDDHAVVDGIHSHGRADRRCSLHAWLLTSVSARRQWGGGTVRCSRGHDNPDGQPYCGTCGAKIEGVSDARPGFVAQPAVDLPQEPVRPRRNVCDGAAASNVADVPPCAYCGASVTVAIDSTLQGSDAPFPAQYNGPSQYKCNACGRSLMYRRCIGCDWVGQVDTMPWICPNCTRRTAGYAVQQVPWAEVLTTEGSRMHGSAPDVDVRKVSSSAQEPPADRIVSPGPSSESERAPSSERTRPRRRSSGFRRTVRVFGASMIVLTVLTVAVGFSSIDSSVARTFQTFVDITLLNLFFAGCLTLVDAFLLQQSADAKARNASQREWTPGEEEKRKKRSERLALLTLIVVVGVLGAIFGHGSPSSSSGGGGSSVPASGDSSISSSVAGVNSRADPSCRQTAIKFASDYDPNFQWNGGNPDATGLGLYELEYDECINGMTARP